jgi:hypothetical protein
MAHDGAPNRDAIRMLERAVGLDPTFAPAWSALGKRYYYDEEYGTGANGTMSRTMPALRRALALDPNLEDAAQQIVSLDTDAGQLAPAYQEAKRMVENRPKSGFAHFTLSYVLRYAGLLRDAARECNAAMRLDPGNYQFRSCALVFLTLRDFNRARDFIHLDAGSEWSNNIEAHLLLREGKKQEALEMLHQLPNSTFFHTRAIEVCYSTTKPPGSDQLVENTLRSILAYRDPEPKYSFAGLYAPCLGNAVSLQLLKAAIAAGYCAYEDLQSDPALTALRMSPEYSAVLRDAKRCQDEFLADRDRPQP